jgi:uncharacterized OB-fold protein
VTAKPLPTPTAITSAYWEAAQRGELQLQRCRRCDERFLYPRLWCPRCWSADLGEEAASGRGIVVACTTVHQAPSAAYARDVPYVVAIVRLLEGPQLMTNVVGCGPSDVRVGSEVCVTFEDRGAMRVPQFELA